MSDRQVIETVYGKSNKYEIIRRSKTLGGFEFLIYKNGKYHRGTFSSLGAAVEAAKSEG